MPHSGVLLRVCKRPDCNKVFMPSDGLGLQVYCHKYCKRLMTQRKHNRVRRHREVAVVVKEMRALYGFKNGMTISEAAEAGFKHGLVSNADPYKVRNLVERPHSTWTAAQYAYWTGWILARKELK